MNIPRLRLYTAILATFSLATAHAFEPVCPQFTGSPSRTMPTPLRGVLGELAEAIKIEDLGFIYRLVADDIYLGDGLETRLAHYGLHEANSPMWNELSNALYAGCASLESGEDIWECPGVREELFFGTGEEKYRKRKYSYFLEMARPLGFLGPVMGEKLGGNGDNTICRRHVYSSYESYQTFALPNYKEARKRMQDKDSKRKPIAPLAWFKYSHYRMRFKEINGKWRMTALFRKY